MTDSDSIVAKELAERADREDRIYDKIAQAIQHARHSENRSAAQKFLYAWRAIAGLARDYGEMPAWFRRSKWEHEWTQIPESRLTETLNGYQEQSWQLVSAVIRHPDSYPEVMWVLIFKRPE